MNRRRFFATAVAAIAGLVAPTAMAAPRPLAEIRVRGRDNLWRRVRMSALRPGDVFTKEGTDCLWQAESMPHWVAQVQEWGIQASSAGPWPAYIETAPTMETPVEYFLQFPGLDTVQVRCVEPDLPAR